MSAPLHVSSVEALAEVIPVALEQGSAAFDDGAEPGPEGLWRAIAEALIASGVVQIGESA